MSLIIADIEIPRRTPIRNPIEVIVPVNRPMVQSVHVYFPDGPLGAVGIRLKDRDSQFAPAHPTYGWILDNDRVVEWEEAHKLDGPPWEIRIEGYNIADDHAHNIQIRMTVVQHLLTDLIAELNLNLSNLIRRIKK